MNVYRQEISQEDKTQNISERKNKMWNERVYEKIFTLF